MLLRSISEHVRNQNWFAVGVDLFIVVIGVFIGIQASNWNEERIESQRGDYFAMKLLGDIRRELAFFEFEIDYYTTVRDYAVTTIALIDGDDPALENRFVVSAYNASQFVYSTPAQSTYDELIATGNLHLLRDENVTNTALFLYNSNARSKLSNYVRESAYRERVRRIMPYDVQEAIRAQCGDQIDDLTGFIAGLPADCEIVFDRKRIAAAAAALRNDAELRLDLAFYLSSFEIHISDVAATRRQAEGRLNGSYVGPAQGGLR